MASRGRRAILTRVAGLMLAVLLGALPSAAMLIGTAPSVAMAAGGGGGSSSALPGSTNPLSPGLPVSPITPTVSTAQPTIAQTTTSSAGSSGLSGSGAVAVGVGAIVVLGGIAYFIWRDARRHAPVRRGAGGGGEAADLAGGRVRGSKAPPKPRKLSPAERRRRKRGKARR